MAKNGDKKKDDKEYPSGLKTQTKHGIIAVVFFVLALFFLMSAFDVAGVAGKFTYEKLYLLLGVGYVLLPTLLVLLASSFIKSETPDIGWTRVISGTMFLLSSLGMMDVASGRHSGGLLGEVLSTPFVLLFDSYASLVFLGALLIISILMMFDAKLNLLPFFKNIRSFFAKKKKGEFTSALNENEKEKIKKAEKEDIPIKKKKSGLGSSLPPPLSLLEEDQGKPNTGDIKANANIIKRTLANFGIEVEMDEITIGPTVTRYALKPAEGVKLSRIVGLQNDLALSLAAHPIRIEAPIPGKS